MPNKITYIYFENKIFSLLEMLYLHLNSFQIFLDYHLMVILQYNHDIVEEIVFQDNNKCLMENIDNQLLMFHVKKIFLILYVNIVDPKNQLHDHHMLLHLNKKPPYNNKFPMKTKFYQ